MAYITRISFLILEMLMRIWKAVNVIMFRPIERIPLTVRKLITREDGQLQGHTTKNVDTNGKFLFRLTDRTASSPPLPLAIFSVEAKQVERITQDFQGFLTF